MATMMSRDLLVRRTLRPARGAHCPPSRIHAVQPSIRQQVQGGTVDKEPAQLLAGKAACVVGSGVGGMAAAMSLARLGADVQVFDGRIAPPSGVAPFVVLQARGARALAACGIDLEDAPPEMRFVGSSLHQPDGTTRFAMGWAEDGAPMYGCDSVTLANFVRKRALELYPAIKLNSGCRLVGGDVRQRKLEFEDVQTGQRRVVSADLLVGGDGGESVLRQLIMDQTPGFSINSKPHPNSFVLVMVPSGPGNISGLGKPVHFFPDEVPRDPDSAAAPKSSAIPWRERGHTFAGYSSASPRFGNAAAAAIVIGPRGDARAIWSMPTEFWREPYDEASLRSTLAECFPQLPPACATAFVNVALQPGNVRPLPTSRKCSRIAEPGVVLVGDAAHTVSPSLGQGAQCSLEDGVELGEAIVKAEGDIELACRLYNETRLPEVHALVDLDRVAVAARSGTPSLDRMLSTGQVAASMLLANLQPPPAGQSRSPPFAALNNKSYTQAKAEMAMSFAALTTLAALFLLALIAGGAQLVATLQS